MRIEIRKELCERLDRIGLPEMSRQARIAYLIDSHRVQRKPLKYYVDTYPTRQQQNKARWEAYQQEHDRLVRVLGHPPSLEETREHAMAGETIRFTAKILARLGKQNGA